MEEKNPELIELFTHIEFLLHRYHRQNQMHYGPMGDPRRGQGRILAILKLRPEITQKELSYLLDMRPQSLGEFLLKLEKKGYITRTASDDDRRVVNIKLTEDGSKATEQEFSTEHLFDCLTEEEQENLKDYLNRISEVLETQVGESDPERDFGPRNHEEPSERNGFPHRDHRDKSPFGRHHGTKPPKHGHDEE